MTRWIATCSCGFEADEPSEDHYEMVDASVTHKIRSPNHEEHDTEIQEVEHDG